MLSGNPTLIKQRLLSQVHPLPSCPPEQGPGTDFDLKPNHAAHRKEIARRRTFAIISHPDAGKTTLTEKFLLYGGAVATGRICHPRARTSEPRHPDWMELERQRGISVSSTVLQLNTAVIASTCSIPGHKDFSEDTYRVLTAVDAAIMVIDAGKGIETQTLKLFEVCRQRGVPIFTFMNKLDRPARDPLRCSTSWNGCSASPHFP